MTVTVIIDREYNLEPVPEVGKEYHFWDDGKSSPSRHYICRCERLLTCEEAKTIVFDLKFYPDPTKKEYISYKKTLFEIWQEEIKGTSWIFEEDTDYFVEVSCPTFDDNKLWAARTKWGGWFTLEISFWQGGEIDVTGEKFRNIVENCEEEGEYEIAQEYKETTYDKQ